MEAGGFGGLLGFAQGVRIINWESVSIGRVEIYLWAQVSSV